MKISMSKTSLINRLQSFSRKLLDEIDSETPTYNYKSIDFYKSISIAMILFGMTIGVMLAVAQTDFAFFILSVIFQNQFLQAILFSIPIVLGTYLGERGFRTNNLIQAVIGIIISIGGYGVIGGVILSMYLQDIYTSSILISVGILLVMMAIAFGYVLTNEQPKYMLFGLLSFIPFGFAGVFAFTTTYIYSSPIISQAAGLFSFLGFLLYLVYSCGKLIKANHNPVANGFLLYIAATGVFIHILRLVLKRRGFK